MSKIHDEEDLDYDFNSRYNYLKDITKWQ
jgi:hypothetical protein